MKSAIRIVCLVCVILTVPISALGTTVEFEFTGFIEAIYSNENNALGDVYIGQPFSGWFTYSSVPDWFPNSLGWGVYDQNASIIVTLGTQTLSYIDAHVNIEVLDNYYGEDIFSFVVDGQQGDYDFTGFGPHLIDSTGMVFNSDALPMSFDLVQLDYAKLAICGYKYSDFFQVSGPITSLTLIPEPATLFLFALGAAMLRRKRRT